ncbi:MAG TPA: TetR/AcrR family transcriptional regulator [Nocardioides sp.]|uniref:TetR/AcrR family transcriptional regulator n=1 Tax=uncultured Nocardioides sp. TaxID=198441 RepID=UPI0026308258|nr:TetR/AcrR family transcriptional regulator [uncultured Nocardioides sp.]HRI94028.1 TetR/AcrR family transcriptional regulator [Nocardioides sp.]HRK44064.1 TetR/AcrR family transcriptional regulator [Nocardioides sp.]
MPKNRREIPRDERTGEILIAATELFLKQGYEGTTIGDISAAVGVARANLYWYFPSKDHVFAAVMDRMLGREIMSLEHELQDMDPLSALVRGLADMRRFRGLHQAMHHRMVESEPVRESHERFLGWIRSMVDEVVGTTSQQEDKRMVSDIVVSIFEGANVTEPPLRPAPEMIRYLLRSLVPSDS